MYSASPGYEEYDSFAVWKKVMGRLFTDLGRLNNARASADLKGTMYVIAQIPYS